jgi:ribosome maturation factor RimP
VGRTNVGLVPTFILDFSRRAKEVSVVPDRLESIKAVVEPALTPLDLAIYDVLVGGGAVRLVVDRPGGVDIDTLEAASRAVGPRLDQLPDLPGPYTLEVSSPGVERDLRRPEHFAGAVGETVSVKVEDADGTKARLRGELVAAGADTITIRLDGGDRQIALDAIDQARTVFEWGPAPKPGKGSRPGHAKKEAVGRS